MECWARINGKDYPIALGFTITEEFSESLDSASIRLPHVMGAITMKPYDDVIIHDYGPEGLPPRPLGSVFVPDDGHFYRHMLVHSYTRERVSLQKIEGKYAYNYTISLISETSGLETVQLPNRTITQPRSVASGSSMTDSLASASFAYEDGTYTLPYGTVNKYSDGLLLYIYTSTDFIGSHRGYLYAGDISESTNDYCLFTPMKYGVKQGETFALPDWNISGVAFVQAMFSAAFPYGTIEGLTSFTPTKHWFVIKNGINDDPWKTKAGAVARIKEYLSAASENPSDLDTLFPEFRNADFGLAEIVTSTDSVSSISATVPEVDPVYGFDSYTVYLYVEPKIIKDAGGYSHLYDLNVFGMTDNTHGATIPREESEFLAKWSFRAYSGEAVLAKGVMSVYEAVRQAVELYSPYIKETTDGSTWKWRRKYSIDPATKSKFSSVIAPENQWNYPNLRDYITRLFYVSDCIPVVHDGVIGHMDLSKRNPIPFDADPYKMSYDTESMDGSSYCDRLLRNYSDGLSKDNVVKCVERIGFKNSDSATLTLSNLRIELSHPVYRINKLYMCYYSKFEDAYGNPYMRLCKQDISPLVLLNAQRNLLTEDWSTIEALLSDPKTVKDLAKFKYATIGYDIGATEISGWGMKYNYPKCLFWEAQRTVIENILTFVTKRNSVGIFLPEEDLSGYEMTEEFSSNANDDREVANDEGTAYVTIYNSELVENDIYSPYFGNYTQRLKSLMFIVEYEGFVSSAVMASKDAHDGNVVSRDNASSSLSFLESDGINQKEKVNRLGNATSTCAMRYSDYEDVAGLSQVWNDDDHVDEVLFKRTVSFEKDYFTASYYFCRDYVLRNYFTSVFSKHRPFALASYGESVERQENRCLQVLLSPDKFLWQDVSNRLSFNGDYGKLFSFFVPSSYDSAGNIAIEEGIDTAYYKVYPSTTNDYSGQIGAFSVDVQKFTSGNSLCYVVSMKDNVSGGVFVTDFNHKISSYVGDIITNTFALVGGSGIGLNTDQTISSELITGAKQDWFMFPVDPDTGTLYDMAFSVGFRETDVYAVDGIRPLSEYDIALAQLLPLMDVEITKADLSYEYFGKTVEEDGKTYAIGAGAPSVEMKGYETGTGHWYKAVIDHDTIGKVITEKPYGYRNPDGQDIGERERISEFASSVFRAHETDSSEETENCVFKDGKERIVTTLQFEPISEDSRVMFSEWMFKLSDAMGGKPKNYKETDIRNNIVVKKGLCNAYIYARGAESPDSGSGTYMGVPTMSICIPRDIAYTLRGEPSIEFETEMVIRNADLTSFYELHTKSIQMTSAGRLFAVCDIYMNGQLSVRDESIEFHDLDDLDDGSIPGRIGASDYPASIFCFRESMAYKTFAYLEDYYHFNSQGDNVKISFELSKLESDSPYFMGPIEPGAPLVPSLYRYYFDNLPQEDYDYWSVLAEPEFNYRNIYWKHDHWSSDPLDYNAISVVEGRDGIKELGPQIGETVTRGVNLFWTFNPEKMGIDVPFESLPALEGTVFTSDPDSTSGQQKFLIGTNFKADSDEYGRTRLVARMPFVLTGSGSLRLYYLENGLYRFVFGINMDKEGGDSDNCVLPDESGNYVVYVSFVDDRSRTVIDSYIGDPLYETVNFAEPNTGEPSNKCVAK